MKPSHSPRPAGARFDAARAASRAALIGGVLLAGCAPHAAEDDPAAAVAAGADACCADEAPASAARVAALPVRAPHASVLLDRHEEILSLQPGAEAGLPAGPVTALARLAPATKDEAPRLLVQYGGQTFEWTGREGRPFAGEIAPHAPRVVETPDLRFALVTEGGRPRVLMTLTRNAAGFLGIRARSVLLSGAAHGMPYEDATCLSLAGRYAWFGAKEGCARLDLDRGRWRYFWGRRWLAGNEVRAILALPSGGALVGTDRGLTELRPRPITLEEKALAFSARAQARHDRMGLVANCGLTDADYRRPVPHNSDNDGLWTAMYLGGEVFRAALTGEQAARALCRKHMDAILQLWDITGIAGFPARSYDRYDEAHPLQRAMINRNQWGGPEDVINKWRPADQDRWPGLQWKGDTSPDETDGHVFILTLYYQLLADDDERARIAATLTALVDHIIANGYYLRDLDGRPTTWGKWAPELLNTERPWVQLSLDYGYMNDHHSWWMDRGLRSLSLLTYLAWAEKISGSEVYAREAQYLMDEHGYDRNAIFAKTNFPPTEVNHSDDEMMFLLYDALTRAEPAGRMGRVLARSVERSFAIERPEHNPCWNFVSARAGIADFDLPGAVENLRRVPLDQRHWAVKNSHRHDLKKKAWADRFGRDEADRALWPDERPMMKYNGNPYEMDGGGNGASEEDGGYFVLSYWMGRYYGFLRERYAPRPEAVAELNAHLGIDAAPPPPPAED